MRGRNKANPGGKHRRGWRRTIALMLFISISAALYLGAKGVAELLERKQGHDYYGALAAAQETSPVGAPAADSAVADRSESTAPPDGDRPPAPAIDFDALRAIVPDIVGWLRIDGTYVDYPLVQGADNVHYLSHLPNGAPNAAGSIMMDAACDPAFGNDVTIVHGHHMRSGEMFGDLDEYRKEAYYRAHPTMRLYTPAGDYDVAIIAACGVDGRAFGYPTVFADKAAFGAFVDGLAARSAFQADQRAAYGDRLLLLSTCAYDYRDERFVVLGKILDKR